MKLIQKLVRENYGLVKEIYRVLNEKAEIKKNSILDEIDMILINRKLEKGQEIIFSDYNFGPILRSRYKGNISLENKKLITWAINYILGTKFGVDQNGISDLEKEVGEKIVI